MRRLLPFLILAALCLAAILRGYQEVAGVLAVCATVPGCLSMYRERTARRSM